MKRVRLSELGMKIGKYNVGKWNAITDVTGVLVGHVTLKEDMHIRTGVTAILPHDGNLFQEKVFASSYVINGFGKTIGGAFYMHKFSESEKLAAVQRYVDGASFGNAIKFKVI
ncbi:Peptidase family S58 [Bacillus sp. 491mf]|uniref:P1 family peptidase n=1 Tax=Bacillus TaxID=1386 RepID=UPI00054DA57D|nr:MULTISPECIES: P1 family peptidase [unclassified Bacillus (in: firmicutes)]SFC89206.1 Peptidase family S58 [Bacillus sp. 491mf]